MPATTQQSSPSNFSTWFKGITARLLPTAITDGQEQAPRLDRYGGAYMNINGQNFMAMAEEGSYYHQSSVPGTGIAVNIAATFDETIAYGLCLDQMASKNDPNAKKVYLDYISLYCTAPPANATIWHYAIKTDQVSRYTSGANTTLLGPHNVNTDVANTSILAVRFGPLGTVATGAQARLVAGGLARTVIPKIGDTFTWKFGTCSGDMCALTNSLTTAANFVFPCPPLILGPGSWMGLGMWGVSSLTTASSWELSMGWYER